MASFRFNGMDAIEHGFEQLLTMSDDEKLFILMPAAEFVLERQTNAIKSAYSVISGALSKSLKISKKSGKDGIYLQIAPHGKHPGSSTGKRKKKNRYGKAVSSGSYSGTNAEVLYILEHGSPRIQASHIIEITNEQAEPDVLLIEADRWDSLLKSKGL